MAVISQVKQENQSWSVDAVQALLDMPLMDLLYEAQRVHRQHFDPNEVQVSTLLSIKTGGCPEDCGYCSQSSRNDTGLKATKLMEVDEVMRAARAAKEQGASRFCMGAAWRNPKERDMPALTDMIRQVRGLGLETCMTLGMLTGEQAGELKEAGLDYYNHNLDTAPEFYGNIVTTRTYQERIDTLKRVQQAGMHVCAGGILGLGETPRQRAGLIAQLANLDPYPESVPVNQLMRIDGTPSADEEDVDAFDFIRVIAAARITMPKAWVRLSAGRENMSDTMQALCFMAGANSIFGGERLLTTSNPDRSADKELLARLGMHTQQIKSAHMN